MFCRKCGSELRGDARFCNRCGVPIPNRLDPGESNRRQTIDLPRDGSPLRNADFRSSELTDRLPLPPRAVPPSPPANRKVKKSEAEPRRPEARTQNDLTSPIKPVRSNTVIRNQLATTPISLPTPPRHDPESKPFFTQALTTADKNLQHKRLVTVVLLLLLVVILLFIFAYIAGR